MLMGNENNSPANPLRAWFQAHSEGRFVVKYDHYFDTYHKHFSRFRGAQVTVLEIGVFHGGSVQMWRDYFGPGLTYVGIDVEPRAADLADPDNGVHICIGDQGDSAFLMEVASKYGPFDIVMDDGSHLPQHQLASFVAMFPHTTDNGIYLVEDLHTNYWSAYGAGVTQPETFMRFAQAATHQLNAWYSEEPELLRVDDMTRTTRSIHFYSSIVVFEKELIDQPVLTQVGRLSWPELYGDALPMNLDSDESIRARLAAAESEAALAEGLNQE